MNMKRLPKGKFYTEDQLLKYFGRGRYNTFCSWLETLRPGGSTEPTVSAEDVQRFVNHQAILD
jgi:hypothetical protein